ncbi:MAG TPA: glycosyltransferase family 39 protein [Longimicrobiales bacterium]|nr:glycosyltransferase family 39 protein [Longimicrobiales bacterium]
MSTIATTASQDRPIEDSAHVGTVDGSRAELVALGFFLVIALVLRLHDLGAGLWHDEIATLIHNVRAPLGSVVTNFESQNNHPLYSLLAKLSLLAFGDTPAALRLPAVLFGVGSIGAVYWFGLHVARPREALTAAGLLSVSYHHVWFSQNARAYTALLFFALIGTALCLRMCRAPLVPNRRITIAYAAVMTLALYSHLTAGVILGTHALIWAAAALRTGQVRAAIRSGQATGFILAGFLSLLLYAPGLSAIATGLGGSGPKVDIAWKDPLWMIAETARGLAQGIPGGIVTLAFGALVPVVGAVDYFRRDRIATALMVLPVLITAGLLLATAHNLWPRFFFFAGGFAVLILVRGVFRLARLHRRRGEVLAVGASVLLLAGSVLLLPRAYGPKQDYTGALEYVMAQRGPDDTVATVGIVGFTYQSYLGVDWPPVESEMELRNLAAAPAAVWLVYSMPELIAARSPELWHVIERDFRTAAVFQGTLAGGAIHVRVNR